MNYPTNCVTRSRFVLAWRQLGIRYSIALSWGLVDTLLTWVSGSTKTLATGRFGPLDVPTSTIHFPSPPVAALELSCFHIHGRQTNLNFLIHKHSYDISGKFEQPKISKSAKIKHFLKFRPHVQFEFLVGTRQLHYYQYTYKPNTTHSHNHHGFSKTT